MTTASSGRERLAFACYLLAALAMAASGLVYTLSPSVMPYHEQALGQRWADVPPRQQGLYLALLKSIGVPTLVAAIAILLILIFAWRRRERWASWAVPALTLAWGLPMLGVTLYVHAVTGAATPWAGLALLDACVLGGAWLSLPARLR